METSSSRSTGFAGSHAGTKSRLSTFLNLICMMVGVGSLQLGYVYKNSGLAYATFMLVLMTVLCWWTMAMIPRLFEEAEARVPKHARWSESMDWPIVVEAAAGKRAKVCIRVFFVAHLLLTHVFLNVCWVSCVGLLFPRVAEPTLMRVSICISVVVLCTVPQRRLSALFFLGTSAVAFFVLSMTIVGASLGQSAIQDADHDFVRISGSGEALGAIAVCVVGNHAAGDMYTKMRDKASWRVVTAAAHAFAASVFITVGAVGLLLYGDEVQRNLLSNVGAMVADNPKIAWLTKLDAVLMAMKVHPDYQTVIAPIATQVYAVLGQLALIGTGLQCPVRLQGPAATSEKKDATTEPVLPDAMGAEDSMGSTRTGGSEHEQGRAAGIGATQDWEDAALRVCTKGICVFASGVLSIMCADKLALVTDFFGAATGLGIGLTMPPALELGLFWPSLSVLDKALRIAAVVAGLSMQVLGVYRAWDALNNPVHLPSPSVDRGTRERNVHLHPTEITISVVLFAGCAIVLCKFRRREQRRAAARASAAAATVNYREDLDTDGPTGSSSDTTSSDGRDARTTTLPPTAPACGC